MRHRGKALSEERKRVNPSVLNPNSEPFQPRGFDDTYIPPAPKPPPPAAMLMGWSGNGGMWWMTDEEYKMSQSAVGALSSGVLTRALSLSRTLLQNDLGREREADVGRFLQCGSHDRLGLLSHPLAQLFLPPPRERYVHPVVTDSCMYALRAARTLENSSGKGKFCLAASGQYPGHENNIDEDWLAAVISLLYYGLPLIRKTLEAHEETNCERVCWVCQLLYTFENLDQSIKEQNGQPVALKNLAACLRSEAALSSTLAALSNDVRLYDIPHGLLSRKLYRKHDRLAPTLLSDVYTSRDREGGRWHQEDRITHGVKIRQHDKQYSNLVEKNRLRTHYKIQQVLNFMLHMLSRECKVENAFWSSEFPRLGEERRPPSEPARDLCKYSVECTCSCPATNKRTVTSKDVILLSFNTQRWQELSHHTAPSGLRSDSSVSAFEDSYSSSSDSAQHDGNVSFETAMSSSSHSTLPPTFESVCHNVNFAQLLTDSLARHSRVSMKCSLCADQPAVHQHSLQDVVKKLPVTMGIKFDLTDPIDLKFWRNSSADHVLYLVRKYLRAPSDMLKAEFANLVRSSVLPNRLYMREEEGEWVASAEDSTQGAIEYNLAALICTTNTPWHKVVRSTLFKVWKDDQMRRPRESESRMRERLRVTEVEEMLNERPPLEDTVLAYVKLPDGSWLLCNGPLTCQVSEADVMALSLPYRFPVCVFYTQKHANIALPRLLPAAPIGPLQFPRNLALNRPIQLPTFHPLTYNELKLIEAHQFSMAIDAEFVVTKYLSKCKDHVLGAAPLCELGRFTAIRNEDSEPTPFADFYIEFHTPPVDYRTKFSGLMPNDLNCQTSSHWLTTRTGVYRFIRHMVRNNATFIGHDLFNDFRVMGVIVPSCLIIDTVELFRLSSTSRLLSLKYLAWNVLNMRIQQGHHDSIEDSWASLILYRYYKEKVDREGEGAFREIVSNLYALGYSTNFKAPAE